MGCLTAGELVLKNNPLVEFFMKKGKDLVKIKRFSWRKKYSNDLKKRLKGYGLSVTTQYITRGHEQKYFFIARGSSDGGEVIANLYPENALIIIPNHEKLKQKDKKLIEIINNEYSHKIENPIKLGKKALPFAIGIGAGVYIFGCDPGFDAKMIALCLGGGGSIYAFDWNDKYEEKTMYWKSNGKK